MKIVTHKNKIRDTGAIQIAARSVSAIDVRIKRKVSMSEPLEMFVTWNIIKKDNALPCHA
jgi:hypothetical protein